MKAELVAVLPDLREILTTPLGLPPLATGRPGGCGSNWSPPQRGLRGKHANNLLQAFFLNLQRSVHLSLAMALQRTLASSRSHLAKQGGQTWRARAGAPRSSQSDHDVV